MKYPSNQIEREHKKKTQKREEKKRYVCVEEGREFTKEKKKILFL